jgi:hypothetical protein
MQSFLCCGSHQNSASSEAVHVWWERSTVLGLHQQRCPWYMPFVVLWRKHLRSNPHLRSCIASVLFLSGLIALKCGRQGVQLFSILLQSSPHFPYKERVYETEYGGNIVYSCVKMEKWDLLKFPGMGAGGRKENDGGEKLNYDIL